MSNRIEGGYVYQAPNTGAVRHQEIGVGKRTLVETIQLDAYAPSSSSGTATTRVVQRKPNAGVAAASAPPAQADRDRAGDLIHLLTSSPSAASNPVATYLNTLDTPALLATISDAADCGYLPQLRTSLASARPLLVAALYAVELARIGPVSANDQRLHRAGATLDQIPREQQIQILEYLLHRRGASVEATALVEGVLAMRQGADRDTVAASREPLPAGAGRGAGDEAGSTDRDEQAESTAMGPSIAGGAAGAVSPVTINPAPWAPPGNQPGGLYIGNTAHSEIAAVYQAAHPDDQVFTNTAPISGILEWLTKMGRKNSSKVNDTLAADELARRPDITNVSRRHLYEIKPATAQAQAAAQARMYLAIFEKAGVEMALGPSAEPGTSGGLPAPAGVFLFQSPEPGVITYEYRKGRLVPVPLARPEPVTARRWRWRWELQPLTPQQKQAIVTTTVGGAMLIILMIVLAPVGA